MDLLQKRCVPCEGGVAPIDGAQASDLVASLPGWRIESGRLVREVEFRDFVEAMAHLHRVAKLAEREGHHPDFCVHYKRVAYTLYTHAIDGLSENDFILAAKINALIAGAPAPSDAHSERTSQ